MANNEIRIIVKSVDQTKAGYDSAKQNANMTASDIEGTFGKAGQRGGKKLGDGIVAGVKDGGEKSKGELEKSIGDGIAAGTKRGTKQARDEFGRFTKAIGDDAGGSGGGGGGGGIGSKIKGAITKGFSGGFAEAIPMVATAGIGLAPLLGGIVSAGIIGGAGLGGVLGGVALVAKDPRVANAGKTLGKTLLGSLQSDASVMVEPVLNSIKMIGDSFESTLRPRLANIFKNSATFVAPLTAGLLKGVDGLTEGLDKAIGRAGPVMSSLGDLIGGVGGAIGDMLDTVSGDSEDAAKALDTLTFVLEGAIRGTGYIIRGLTEVYGVLDDGTAKLADFSRWLSRDVPDSAGTFAAATATAAGGAMGLNEEFAIMKSRASGIQGPIATLTDEINGFSEASRTAYGAATSVGEALLNVKEAAEKNGKTLKTNTKEGLANREALQGLASASIAQYNATVKLNGEGEKANGVANKNRAAFIKAAMAMGDSREAAGRLADELGLIKAPKPLKFDNNADAVKRKVQQLQAEINRMHGKTIPITVRVTTKGETLYGNQAPQMAHGGIKGAADGGNRSGLTWVGEHGPELVSLPAGTSVRSNEDSQRAMRGMGGGGQSGGPLEITLRFDPSGAPAAISGLMEGIRAEVRNQGGSVQTVLGVAGVS